MAVRGLRAAQGLRAQVAGSLGQRRQGRHGRAGNLQQDLGRRRKRPPDRQQHAPGAHIERGGELEELFPISIVAAHKNRYGKGQPGPFSPFAMFVRQTHTIPVAAVCWRSSPQHLGGQCRAKPRQFPHAASGMPESSQLNIHRYRHFRTLCSVFVHYRQEAGRVEMRLESARFCYTWVIRVHFSLTTSSARTTILRYAPVLHELSACSSPHIALVLQNGHCA
jgi:hypothetical protein